MQDRLMQLIELFLSMNNLYERLLISLLLLAGLFLLRMLLLRLAYRRSQDVRLRYRWRKSSSYILGFAALIVVAWIWLEGLASTATFLGLLSAGLAIAMREPLVGLLGWFFIMIRRPFDVGDRIAIGADAGDVVDIRLFQFTILEIANWVHADQSTGRILHIPNARIFTDVLANYTQGFEFIWHELEVRITFDSNWERAKALLSKIATRHGRDATLNAEERLHHYPSHYLILYKKLTPIVYTTVDTYGILLTIRYLCQPRRRRSTEAAIWEDVLRALAQAPDIEFAYPTQRFYTRSIDEPAVPRQWADPPDAEQTS